MIMIFKKNSEIYMNDKKYIPPKVRTWYQEIGGRFANINRPISGATHDKELPVGNIPCNSIRLENKMELRSLSLTLEFA